MELIRRFRRALAPPPDLDTQLETLLDQVWESEERERMNDRIDLAIAADEWRERARRKAKRDTHRGSIPPGP